MSSEFFQPKKQAICLFIKILITIFFIGLIGIGSIQVGSAEISFSCSIYNSVDSASETVWGENLNFDGTAMLENALVSVAGKGSTINNQSFYSYELVSNGDRMQSAAQTDSGQLDWVGSATADDKGSVASISPKASISDGNYTACYKNSDLSLTENVSAIGSKFQEVVSISPHFLSAQGGGLTAETISSGVTAPLNQVEDISSNGDEIDDRGEGIRGLDHSLLVEGFGRWLRIDSQVLGRASLQWLSGVECSPSGYSLKMMVAGVSNEESGIDHMKMVGSGNGFPPQILPAGRLDMNRIPGVNPNSTIDASFINREIEAFNLDNSINESLDHWYNLNHSSMVNLTATAIGEETNMVPGVRFRMKMALELDN